MQAFRNAAKPVIYVVTIAFFVWLVWDLSGLGSGTGGLLAKTSVGKVNGRAVDLRGFDQRVQNVVSEQQQRGTSIGLDEMAEVRNRVWDQVVQEFLLREEYKRRAVQVSSDELAEAIRSIPLPEFQQAATFKTNGQFDLEKYQRWLASAEGQAFIPSLEYQYRSQLMQSKLFRSVVADVFISDATLWERYRDEREQVKIGLVRIDPAASVNDQAAPVTDAEAEGYYNQHRDEFKRGAAAYLSYVSVPRRPVASDTAAARERAVALKDEIEKGAPFEEIAKRESSDSASATQGGDLGEHKKADLVPEFSNVAMTLPLKTVSDPVLSPFGFHLIKVESRAGDSFKARHILIPIEVTGEHRDHLDKVADSLEALASEKPDRAALDTAARALTLQVQPVGPVAKGNRVFVAEGAVPDAGTWAFQAKVGEHSRVIDAPNAFYVFRLDSLQKEGIPSFAEAKAVAIAKVRAAKKVVEARRLGEQLTKQVAGGVPLEQAGKAMGFDYREIGPFARLSAPLPSPVLVGASFGLKPGETSQPIEADDHRAGGDPAVYVVTVVQKTPVDSADFAKNLAAIRQQALQAAKRSRVESYLAGLRAQAKVVDNRDEVYKSSAQTAASGGLPGRR